MDFKLRRRDDQQPPWPPLLRAHPLEFGCLMGVGFALGAGAVAALGIMLVGWLLGNVLHTTLPFFPTPTP